MSVDSAPIQYLLFIEHRLMPEAGVGIFAHDPAYLYDTCEMHIIWLQFLRLGTVNQAAWVRTLSFTSLLL